MPQDLIAHSHRGAEVGVADRDDRKIRCEDEIEPRGGFEKHPKIRRRDGLRHSAENP